jgi:S-adenosylmethionine:tRNA ribosyltransferase-isomerase
MTNDRLLSSYDYELPSALIAQTPVVPRDSSRLLVVDSPTTHVHHVFRDLVKWLQPGDLLVFNDTRVLPARLYGHKSTGAPVEILLLEERAQQQWLALVKPGKRFKIGTEVVFDPLPGTHHDSSIFLKAKVIDRDQATGGRVLQFQVPEGRSFWSILEQFGQIPFPPYVTAKETDPAQYQTVYAHHPGAAAAPTAGLHFTEDLLQDLEAQGVGQAYLTLHIGLGTFRPVEVEDITTHAMHQEWLDIPPKTIEQIAQTKARGRHVIAVGTTVVRALEGLAREAAKQAEESLFPFRGKTDIFIYPGYRWQVIDGLITNFHLPKSSLLMLVSAFLGRDRVLKLYQEAIEQNYRFYSFGDAMFILPSAKSLDSGDRRHEDLC